MSGAIRFLLNGAPRRLTDIDPLRTLLDHLRLEERLTGTKEGCAEGDCGACTVALGRPDGAGGLAFQAVNACILPVGAIDGAALVTVEGLAAGPGKLHPVQRAMIDHHGSQCGFCTPGFVVSMFAYDQSRPTDDKAGGDEGLHQMLAGNLCRCTGYRPILDAARAVAAEPPDPATADRIAAWRPALEGLMAAPAPAWRPTTLEELDQRLVAEPGVRLVAGATDLGVGIAKHGVTLGPSVSVAAIPALATITESATAVELGAAVTYSAALPVLDRHFPAFAAIVRRIGSVQIRNSGTIGGNLCNASPIGDSAPCLIALGAILTLRSAAGTRTLAVEDFFTAYRRTALRPGEYLAGITIPTLTPDQRFHAYKLAKRREQDISTVAVGIRLTLDGPIVSAARIAYGGMAATPVRAPAVEAALIGRPLDPAAITAAAEAVAASLAPIGDFRATARYRSIAAGRIFTRLAADFAGTSPDLWAS